MRFTSVFLAAAALLAQETALVSTSSGRMTGKDLGGVRAWLGIPYAAPPVGELRWKPPQPPRPWSGVRAMKDYGPPCMQPPREGLTLEPSEDCLTLNVWAPEGTGKHPVMVWIHGGAFRQGSGSLPAYSGTSLARKGVVVVTINYRLGDFGFFAHPELTKEAGGAATGNYGLMDQIAALEWVRQNIAAFGGDPGNVTIFGESAGAASVIVLMASPKARGLFQRAIAESGGLGTGRRVKDLEQLGVERAKEWGAADLKALRALPAKEILAKPRPVSLGAYGPVVDGVYLPAPPAQVFEEGRQAPVPFLIGANSYEGSLMGPFKVSPASLAGLLGVERAKLEELYGGGLDQTAHEIFGDAVFVAPARFLAARMERVSKPAFLYHFSYVLERRRGKTPGAPHGSEIPFVFNNLSAGALAAVATEADRKMAELMSSYWVQFAMTGDPNGAGKPHWPAYLPASDELLEFGVDVAVRKHFRKDKLDFLESRLKARSEAR